MSMLPNELLDQLLALVDKLRDESQDFEQTHEDTQQWYNRGYANGISQALINITDSAAPVQFILDDVAVLQGHEVMAWGKAYRHGEEVGMKETYEITGQN